jgi:AmmeMemoRadiSam system protein A
MAATSNAPPTGEVSDRERPAAEGPLPVDLPADVGEVLLRLARAVVHATASGRLRTTDLLDFLPREPPAALLAPSAAFVTLHEGGDLRGCVGSLETDVALWETVTSAAVGAAARDPRFFPVTEREISSLLIEVSVLGPPVPLPDPSAFRPGIDGIIVERGGRRGLLLPEVATDQGWNVGEMLDCACRKAGLPEDAWLDARTQLFVFRTARVSDADANDGIATRTADRICPRDSGR